VLVHAGAQVILRRPPFAFPDIFFKLAILFLREFCVLERLEDSSAKKCSPVTRPSGFLLPSMADHVDRDAEKHEQQASGLSNISSTEADSHHEAVLKETEDKRSTRRRDSNDTDPLSELGSALEPENIAEPITPINSSARPSRNVSRVRTGTSIGSAASRPPDFEVSFEADDPENPKNWPLWYRMWVVFVVSWACFSVVIFSSNYASSIPGLMAEYDVSNETIVTLGITTYLVGLAIGSLIMAPMSELFGRKIVYIVCQAITMILIIPTGLATSLAEILVVRFFM
jgi:hypothetical protein